MGVNIEFVVMPSTKAITFFLLVSFWELRPGYSQSYVEMKWLNASCSPYDSCSPTCSPSRRELQGDNLILMNCECKSSCARYGTCCLDSPRARRFKRKLPVFSPHDLQFSCESTADNSSTAVFMISKCKQGWQQDHEIKSNCESNMYDYKDPYSLVPFTNPKSATTYKNYYCAFCNEDADDSVPWKLNLRFKRTSVYKKYRVNLNQIFEDLVYDSSYQKWGVEFQATETVNPFPADQDNFIIEQELIEDVGNDSEVFQAINLSLCYPSHLQNSITSCDANLVSDCSPDWTDKTIRDKCHSFMGIVYANVEASFGFPTTLKFRNVYCAICNFITDMSSIMCRIPGPASGDVGSQPSTDVNVDKVPICTDIEVRIKGR